MEHNEKIDFRKIRDFGGILSVTFDFIRQNFKKLFLSLIFICGPAILLVGILNGLNLFNLSNLTNNLQGDFSLTNTMWTNISVYIAMFIAVQLIFIVTYSYLELYIDRYPEEFTISDVWKKVREYFWLFFITSISSFFLIALGTLLLIIPGIYLTVVLSLIYIVRIREKLSFFDALNRCRNLITNEWWYTLGLIIVLYLIQIPFDFVLSVPSYIIVFLRVLHFQGGSSIILDTITIITTVITAFGYIFYSIAVIGITFHYFSLVEKKEATGLFDKLNSINTQN